MGAIRVTETIEAPVAVVFSYIDDHRNTIKYMRDLTCWEPVGDITHGKGAAFRVGMKAGPKVLESTVDIHTWTENKTIAWRSSAGFQQTGKWSLSSKGETTTATFEMEYDLGGGIAGKMLAKVAEPVVRSNIEKSVAALREQTEKLAQKSLTGSRRSTARV